MDVKDRGARRGGGDCLLGTSDRGASTSVPAITPMPIADITRPIAVKGRCR